MQHRRPPGQGDDLADQALSVVFIEVVRGVPFISILYMATLLFPLMLPHGASIDKFLRARVALILFVSAYMAEIVRAGLSSVPRGQTETGDALGLSHRSSPHRIAGAKGSFDSRSGSKT